MKTKFVEATQAVDRGLSNHGKFMVGRFEREEWERDTQLDPDGISPLLLLRCGWSKSHVLVSDLQTGEGAMFVLGGSARADLNKTRIWVCPMFEPFLTWLYEEAARSDDWFEILPPLVELPDAPFAMQGYRREGAAT